ncbi:ATP-binding protein [Ihubacter massiliensis]|uniref:ATP-binding protein n=1 Tax=Hominibacterium faecale TaxID=2839743 RepID=A0A9J6QSN0_9FIRM|nr:MULTISPECIES: ATP-binding protein [Eubacteriales Family XIII. Incertae Sedis]MCO7121520.1 ATP-binding protein [Ihubacter massiliensis]MCU7378500.1 ATP-binding protein [Hominibacterium faecale]
MICRDFYIQKIRPFIDKDVVKVMSGIRRSGKSVMLELIQRELLEQGRSEDSIIMLNFESRLLPFAKNVQSAFDYLKPLLSEKKYLFFDEIQDLPGWEELVNSLMIDFDVDIYITGSNAKLLSGELATYLGGRYVEIKIYPFSFAEILDIMRETQEEVNEAEAFLHYLSYGGMPFIYQNKMEEQAALMYLEDLFDSIILKDVAQRNKIRDIGAFKNLLLYFIAEIGNTYSAASIKKYLKNENRSVSTETLYNYIEYCKDACILQMVSREDLIGKKILQFQEKIYLTDHGLRQAVYGHNQRDINQILENIVFMELLRRDYNVTIGKANTREVDFAAKKREKRIYVQVAYMLADEKTVEREFGVLEEIPDNYPKFVITMDEIERSRNGILHRNIREFLKGQEF